MSDKNLKVSFSKHATERMEERGISSELILKAINNPDKINRHKQYNQYLLKYKYKKDSKNRLLLIIFKKQGGENLL